MHDKSSANKPPSSDFYFMESEEEAIRLDIKTDPDAVRDQARWCGLAPGMRVLDAGCGAGITTSILAGMVQPGGSVLGLDYSSERVEYAKTHYSHIRGVSFELHDLRNPLNEQGRFDLIWIRFVLEYHRVGATDIVRNLIEALKPGGCLCLLDLDFNCLIHYELPSATMEMLRRIMEAVDERFNFDTFIGRKLYSFLYDAGMQDISVGLRAHNLFYGEMNESSKFNLTKKIETAGWAVDDLISASYRGGYRGLYDDFIKYINDPRRFSYTPLIMCRGFKPAGG